MMKNTTLTKNAVPVLALLISILFNSSNASVPGFAAGELRPLPSFDKIDISGAFKVILVQGDREQVLLEGETGDAKKIITKVEKGTLEIYHREKTNFSGEMVLTVTFKNIQKLDCSGAVELSSASLVKCTNLELDLSGASKIELEITAEKLDVDISGAGKVLLKGKAKNTDIDISGTGSIAASDLETETSNIDISGAGNASLFVTTMLKVEISGTGSVKYKGDPSVSKEISGAGKLTKL